MYSWRCESPFGEITMASDGKNLTGLWLEQQKYFGATLQEYVAEENLPIFEQTTVWLEQYFRGGKPEIKELPLAPKGSEFRMEVWRLLCQIPYGEVKTYGEIAKKIAEKRGLKRMSAQAVGGAVGHNPISIIIPCHRVIGSDGSLTGYAGGVELKRKLLKHEGVRMIHKKANR